MSNGPRVRDGIGSPTQADWVNGTAWTRTFGYDAMNRLTRETHIVNQQMQWENTWTYDWVGNRLDTGFVYDEDTDWLSEGPQDVERLYTGAGSMYDKDGTGYTYNAQELLSGVGSTTMAWDAESRRVSLSVGNDAYTFVYDPTASIPAVVQEFGPGGRSIIYAREPGGSLIARVNLSEPKVYFHYFDALGSTVLVANNLGQVTDRYAYDAWGNVVNHTGTTQQPYQYVGELGYYTHHQDPNLDLLQLGVRFYDPETGRFTQRDPMAGPPESAYSYVGAVPTLLTDSSGLSVDPNANWESPEQWIRECVQKCMSAECHDDDFVWALEKGLGLCAAISAGTGQAECAGFAGGLLVITDLVRRYSEKENRERCTDFCTERLKNWRNQYRKKHPRDKAVPVPPVWYQFDEDSFCWWLRNKRWPKELHDYMESLPPDWCWKS